jgi:dTDP-4-dehydrorhamnose reductase
MKAPLKLLLLGKNGQVGWELQRSLAPLGDLVALDRHDAGGDLTQHNDLQQRIEHENPDVIINAAAYTAVDKAESERQICHLINADAVTVMAKCTKKLDSLLVHYSTDYVFNGHGQSPWKEADATAPLNEYGRSKLAGEEAIRQSGCNHLIFRTSWVYGARGGNFAKTMIRLATARSELKVINDQFGAPTGADLIADVTAHAIRSNATKSALQGLYHLVASGETTWHGYAKHVLARAGAAGLKLSAEQDRIFAVSTSDFPTAAKRPLNSRLDISLLESQFGLSLPNWQIGVDRMLTEFLGSQA